MRKILFVIDSLTSGGAEKSLLSLLTLFDYKNNEVDLLMFSPGGLYLPLLPKEVNVLEVPKFIREQFAGLKGVIKNKGVKDLYIKLGSSISLRNPIIRKKMHGAQINWKWISKGSCSLEKKYDVAIAYSQGMPTYFVAEKVTADKKLSWVNVDYRATSYNKEFDLKYYKKFDYIIAVSDICKEILVEELPSMRSKIKVVYDIISPTLIKTMAKDSGGFQDKYDGLRILTIGRLVTQKGYEMAIEACNKLNQDGLEFKWYVIGEGPLKGKLENKIKEYGLEEKFILLGTHYNPYTFLKQSDIYVQPSLFEGYGLAIAEARILEKPIVATNFKVIHNQIRDRENGLIVRMNSQDLFDGIIKMINDPALRNKINSNLKKEKVGTEEEIYKIYSLIESA